MFNSQWKCTRAPWVAKFTLCLFTAISALSTGCGTETSPANNQEPGSEAATPSSDSEIDTLYQWMVGTFDSSEQASTNATYYGVQLQMCAVDAPDLGTHVLYVEQAMLSDLNSPYRQRLYSLSQNESGEYVSEVYALNVPQSFVGICETGSNPTFLAGEYALKEGCAVYLEKNGDAFTGSTRGKDCNSLINGASYATSEVSIYENTIESWDRGFTNQDNQVWGATDGPYVFKRQSNTNVPDPVDTTDPGTSDGDDQSPDTTVSAAGETCETAPFLANESTAMEPGSTYTHTLTAAFGQSNDYNPYMESGLAPGCSPVYDSMGKDVVFQVTLEPGDTLFTKLELPYEKVPGIYMLDDCTDLTWPDVDESGMCGRSEYSSHGFCGYGCEPLEWSFHWPTAIGGLPTATKTFFLVIDEVIGDTAENFTLDWSIVSDQ